MKISTLISVTPLKKSYVIENSKLSTISYPNALNFTSKTHEVTSLHRLVNIIKDVAKEGGCLLKGLLNHPLNDEPRRGATNSTDPTQWICLDIDGLPTIDTPTAFLNLLPEPFQNTSYIVQYSASMGVTDEHLHCHIFMLLDTPVAPQTLKFWIQHINLTIFSEHLTLRKNGNSIRWVLDDTTCQNDKLLYIAPPNIAPEVVCSFKNQRIQYCIKKNELLNFNFELDVNEVNKRKAEKINELRKALGFPAFRKNSLRTSIIDGQTIEIQHNASPCVVTGIKTERDFVYFNLNGGDSWGYFHPQDKPDILYNFKGEPCYLTSAILPDYWKPIQEERNRQKEAKKLEREETKERLLRIKEENKIQREYVAQTREEKKKASYYQAVACPVAEDGYRYFSAISKHNQNFYFGRYHPLQNVLECYETTKKDIIAHYFTSFDQPIPAYFPFWTIEFAFDNPTKIDIDGGYLNLYTPSEYMTRQPKLIAPIPYSIRKLFMHALGNDDEVFDRFMHWLAYIVQKKNKTGVAWVLHGVEGTGKGLMFEYVLRPIFGSSYVHETFIDTLADDQFNAFLENNILCLINEADLSDFMSKSKLNAKMKTYITDPFIQIRRMYTSSYEARSFTNYLIFSNVPLVATISLQDRRWSVAKFQNNIYPAPSPEELDTIKQDLPQFVDFLKTFPLDEKLAKTPLINEDRKNLQELSMTTSQEFVHMVKTGNLDYFIENRPDYFEHPSETKEASRFNLPTYDEVLDFIIENERYISRDQLQVLYHHLTNRPYATPSIWTRYMKHLGLRIKAVAFKNFQFQGLNNIDWVITPQLIQKLERKRNEITSSNIRSGLLPSANKTQRSTRSTRFGGDNESGFRKIH